MWDKQETELWTLGFSTEFYVRALWMQSQYFLLTFALKKKQSDILQMNHKG